MRELCPRLAARGHRVKVISSELGIPSELPRDQWIDREGYQVCYMPAGKLAVYPPHVIPTITEKLKT